MNKDIEDFVKKCEIFQTVKICRKNLSQPSVVIVCTKLHWHLKNTKEELRSKTQVYHIEYKVAKTVVKRLEMDFMQACFNSIKYSRRICDYILDIYILLECMKSRKPCLHGFFCNRCSAFRNNFSICSCNLTMSYQK